MPVDNIERLPPSRPTYPKTPEGDAQFLRDWMTEASKKVSPRSRERYIAAFDHLTSKELLAFLSLIFVLGSATLPQFPDQQ